MVIDYREKLSFLFRTVRKTQKKSQTEIVSGLGISQTALAKFESNKAAALSLKKLSEIAPKLNINPDYVLNGFGNPFKQDRPDSIIKMFFTEDPLGKINPYLIDLIIESNDARTLLLFLKPNMPIGADRRLLRMRGERHFYSLVMKDSDDNLFLFRREDKDAFFDETELMELIKTKPTYHNVIIDSELFSKIRENWSEVNFSDIRPVLEFSMWREDAIFLHRLIKKISSHSDQSDQEDYEKISQKIKSIDKAAIRPLLDRLLPEIGSSLKKLINH